MPTSSDWRAAARVLAAAGDPGTRPVFCVLAGRPAATYSATRFTLRRDAVEALPPEGLLVVHIRPEGESPFTVALTRTDAERDFSGVFESGSWDTVRYYNWPRFPDAAAKYILPPSSAGTAADSASDRATPSDAPHGTTLS